MRPRESHDEQPRRLGLPTVQPQVTEQDERHRRRRQREPQHRAGGFGRHQDRDQAGDRAHRDDRRQRGPLCGRGWQWWRQSIGNPWGVVHQARVTAANAGLVRLCSVRYALPVPVCTTAGYQTQQNTRHRPFLNTPSFGSTLSEQPNTCPVPPSPLPQVAVNDIGSAEDFLAAIDKTIWYFNDGDIVEGTIVGWTGRGSARHRL